MSWSPYESDVKVDKKKFMYEKLDLRNKVLAEFISRRLKTEESSLRVRANKERRV